MNAVILLAAVVLSPVEANIRHEYAQDVAAMRAEGVCEHTVAVVAHRLRREIGEEYKAMLPCELRDAVRVRNIKKYGDPLGPTYCWLVARGRSDTQIADAAGRVGGKDLFGATAEEK